VSALALAAVPPATAPPARRDDVRLLVAIRSDASVRLARFTDLPELLRAGDLLVVNDSATLPAAVRGRADGEAVVVHFSTPLPRERWVVELRTAQLEQRPPAPRSTRVALPGGYELTVLGPYRGSARLVEAAIAAPSGVVGYLNRHGSPIRYPGGARPGLPIGAYQTIFAREEGSAEMASAGRPFTPELVAALADRGVRVAPLTLHAGVSSLESGEPPYPERYDVPAATAKLVNETRAAGGRVIAVGTTVVRALETVTRSDGTVRAGAGETSLLITPARGVRTVDALLTGWHEPESSHLLMLRAVAGEDLLARSYAAAAEHGLQGHEFGDAHLILP
jgi:S-adenosylmethionine:tRNA ribosyltransferase-isomerase